MTETLPVVKPEGKLKIFISWSMPLSHEVAKLLREWLPREIQDVEPWVSSEDIEKGTYWTEEIVRNLDEAVVGIIVVTPENHERTWLNFEAGALARYITASGGRVLSPLLVNMEATSFQGPLNTLQVTPFEKEEIHALLQAINRRIRSPLNDNHLRDELDDKWHLLSDGVDRAISRSDVAEPDTLDVNDMLGEILTGIRELRRTANNRWTGRLTEETLKQRERELAVYVVDVFDLRSAGYKYSAA